MIDHEPEYLGVNCSLDDLKLAGLPDINPEDIVGKEVIEHPAATNDRTVARRLALQVLYEVDSVQHILHEVLALQFAFHQPTQKVREYTQHLVEGIVFFRPRIDRVIAHFAPEFPLNQVALVDRNILRIAIFEIALDNDRVPVGAAIMEAVEMGKLYGAESTSRFVNGVLGTVAADMDAVRKLLGDEVDTSSPERGM